MEFFLCHQQPCTWLQGDIFHVQIPLYSDYIVVNLPQIGFVGSYNMFSILQEEVFVQFSGEFEVSTDVQLVKFDRN